MPEAEKEICLMNAAPVSGTVLSILMLAGLALAAGGGYIFVRHPEYRKRAWLMMIAGLVMFANVAIWTIPL
jgi:LPXTG-motif cell wall-anchored protein